MIDFERSLLERGGTIVDIGDLGDRRARRTIDASGLYIVPFDPPGTDANGERRTLAPDMPAYFHLSRDPQGRDVVWTLAGDVEPAQPGPSSQHCALARRSPPLAGKGGHGPTEIGKEAGRRQR